MAKTQVSPEVVDEALKVAKSTVRPGQTKEQTKIIAQGIEKGIAEFKKREKVKARERDKERKKALKANKEEERAEIVQIQKPNQIKQRLPWGLLVLSWVGFGVYLFFVK